VIGSRVCCDTPIWFALSFASLSLRFSLSLSVGCICLTLFLFLLQALARRVSLSLLLYLSLSLLFSLSFSLASTPCSFVHCVSEVRVCVSVTRSWLWRSARCQGVQPPRATQSSGVAKIFKILHCILFSGHPRTRFFALFTGLGSVLDPSLFTPRNTFFFQSADRRINWGEV